MGNVFGQTETENDTGSDIIQTYQHLLRMGFKDESLALVASKKFRTDINGAIEFIESNTQKMAKKPVHKKEDISKLHQRLLRLGFDDDISLKAAQECKNDIMEALQFIEENTPKNERSDDFMDKFYAICGAVEEWYVCGGYIEDCKRVQELICSINKCMSGQLADDILSDTTFIKQMQNDYIHVLKAHDVDGEFEFIFNQLNLCHIEKCNMFKRVYRDRNIENEQNKCLIQINAIQEIIDIIHCYYFHSYDIGVRLSKKEKHIIENCDDEKGDIPTIKMRKLNDVLIGKRKIYQNIEGIQKQTQKFNQFDNNTESKINVDEMNKYSFGYEFDYNSINNKYNDDDRVKSLGVSKKYSSLKEELLNNDICHIKTLDEYNIEYKKAECSLNTDEGKNKTMELIHIFCVMIYCNLDYFQSQFSKTYRKLNTNETDQQLIQRHRNFYHFGQNLSNAVNKNGLYYDSDDDPELHTFYHGLNGQMTLPAYVINIIINSPLSTTSDRIVAHNFTYNNGLILQLAPHWKKGCGSTNLYCKWLSNYPHEEEHLFIQNDAVFYIRNIINTLNGSVYAKILDALRIMDQIGQSMRDGFLFRDEEKVSGTYDLIQKIIQHQLSYKLQNFTPIQDFDGYAGNILNIYCQNKTCVEIKYKTNTDYVYKELCCTSSAWIKLKLIHILFPNMETLITRWVKIDKKSIEESLGFLGKTETVNSNFKELLIKESKGLNALEVATKYGPKFEQIGFQISRKELGSVFVEKNGKYQRVPQYFMSIQRKGTNPKYVSGKKISSTPEFAQNAYFM